MKKFHFGKALLMALLVVPVLSLCLTACGEDNGKGRLEIVDNPYYQAAVANIVAENQTLGDTMVDCVFIGDSWTAGWTGRYPLGNDQYEEIAINDFFPEIKVLNRGIGGDNTWGLLQRLDASVYQVKPKVVVLLIGGNNMDSYHLDIEKIITEIKTNLPDTKIVMQSMYTMIGQDKKLPKIKKMSQHFKTLAEQYELAFVDVYTPLLDANGQAVAEYHIADGVHISPAGYRVIAEQLKPVIYQFLGVKI